MKKVLVLPYWMKGLSFYKPHPEITTRIGELQQDDFNADCVIGFSMGALIVLQSSFKITGQIILINPLLPKQNLLIWFYRWRHSDNKNQLYN